MAGSRDSIEEIRNRLGILEVISEYVTLQHAGKGHKGLCPFHAEKTPSFTVSEEFQSWHCFGCGEHGDIFSFVMKIERLTFAEALERLAKRAGVVLDTLQDHRPSRRELLAGINSLASTYYFELLKRSPSALEYLRGRGLADQTIEQFRLGYAAPSPEGLTGFLLKKGVEIENAAELGLVRRSERGGYYDWFRHRVIFPIFDIQGRVIAFGGRAFTDEQPKYLNSPDTPVFSKSKSLYGLNLARKSIAEGGYAVVMEGYLDVITAHQAGFSQCIATLGTALTSEHVKVLSRYAKKAVLAYDADSAGMKATLRSAPMFEEAECEVRIARLPSGEDPDSLIRKGRGAEFSAALTGALPVVEYKLYLLKERHDLSTSSGRGEFLNEAAKVLAEVTSLVERDRYIKDLISYHPNWDIGQSMATQHMHADVNKLAMHRQSTPGPVVRPRRSTSAPASGLEKAQRAVLKLLIRGGDAGRRVHEALSPEDFPNEVCRAAAKILFEKFCENEGIYLRDVMESDGDAGRFISELVMKDSEPVAGSVLEEYILLIKNSRLRKARTSEIIAPYMRNGIIDPDAWGRSRTTAEYEEFLKKTGRKTE